MTNEEVALAIQGGDESLYPQLWEQVERFVRKMANKWAFALDGVEFDDLYQSGYLAMVAAVQTFDPAKEKSFIGWLTFYLKSEFLDAAGRRSGRQINDALHGALSLDKIVDENGKTTLGDLVLDPDGLHPLEEVENSLWREELRAALDKAVATLPEVERGVIQRRFFQGHTLKTIGEDLGVGPERVRQRERKALMALRRPGAGRELRGFIEERTPYYMSVGASRFQSTHSSAVEEIVLLRERMGGA